MTYNKLIKKIESFLRRYNTLERSVEDLKEKVNKLENDIIKENISFN